MCCLLQCEVKEILDLHRHHIPSVKVRKNHSLLENEWGHTSGLASMRFTKLPTTALLSKAKSASLMTRWRENFSGVVEPRSMTDRLSRSISSQQRLRYTLLSCGLDWSQQTGRGRAFGAKRCAHTRETMRPTCPIEN